MKLPLRVFSLLTAVLVAISASAQYGSTPIKHVIVIFQENRTPDNLFQGLCTANGGVPGCTPSGTGGTYDIVSTYVNTQNQTVPLQPVGLATNFDLDHSHGGPKLNGTISGLISNSGASASAANPESTFRQAVGPTSLAAWCQPTTILSSCTCTTLR